MPNTPSSDVLERLRRKHQVLPEQGSGSITVDPATGETIVNCTITDDGYRLVNPDGPEAAATIERLSAELERKTDALTLILRLRPAGDLNTAKNTRALIGKMERIASAALSPTTPKQNGTNV